MECRNCGKELRPGLRFCGNCGVPVVEPADASPGAAGPLPSIARPSDPMIGRNLLGQYIIRERLGEGGMGTAYLADQVGMDRLAVVKVLHPHLLGDARWVERFNREAKVASKLNHPNSITLYNFGRTEEGYVYIAMEYVDGRGLSSVIEEEGYLSVERATQIAVQICGALQQAHELGIVHRDLKPDNILLTWRGKQEIAKVLDFGIAKLQNAGHEERPITATGMIFGTPAYMSPEQFGGVELDGRSDLYSLGVIIYEMLTGRRPFMASSPIGYFRLHQDEIPPPMRVANPEVTIPRDLERLVFKALEKDRANRFIDADEMAHELELVLAKAEVESSSVSELDFATGEPLPALQRDLPMAAWLDQLERSSQSPIPTGAARPGAGISSLLDRLEAEAVATSGKLGREDSPTSGRLRLAELGLGAKDGPSGMDMDGPPPSADGLERWAEPSPWSIPTPPAPDPEPLGRPVAPLAMGGGFKTPEIPLSDLPLAASLPLSGPVGDAGLIHTEDEDVAFIIDTRADLPGVEVANGRGPAMDDAPVSGSSPELPGRREPQPGAEPAVEGRRHAAPSAVPATRAVPLAAPPSGPPSSPWISPKPIVSPAAVSRVAVPVVAPGPGSRSAAAPAAPQLGAAPFARVAPSLLQVDGAEPAFHAYAVEADPPTRPLVQPPPSGSSEPGSRPRVRPTALMSPPPPPRPVPYVKVAMLGLVLAGVVVAAVLGGPGLFGSGSKPTSPVDGKEARPAEQTMPVARAAVAPRAAVARPPARQVRPAEEHMVLIPAGTFQMGHKEVSGAPPHEVHLDAFLIDRQEVSNGEYRLCVLSRDCFESAFVNDDSFNRSELPVVGVSYEDAQAYCQWRGRRLPSEAEWERAARGPIGLALPWGEEYKPGLANVAGAEDGAAKTAPAAAYPAGASSEGLLNMAGNVAEWVADSYPDDRYPRKRGVNPRHEGDGRRARVRGGSWISEPASVLAAHRGERLPRDTRRFNIGFRCAGSVEDDGKAGAKGGAAEGEKAKGRRR